MPALSRRAFAGLVACACLPATAALGQAAPQTSPTGRYTCPPCGCAYDEKIFDKPGVCPDPACAMTLIPAPEPPPAQPRPGAPSR